MISDSDLASDSTSSLASLVERDWLERLCTLQVLANHGDLEASDILQAWCAHDPEAHQVRVAMATTCRSIQLTDEH